MSATCNVFVIGSTSGYPVRGTADEVRDAIAGELAFAAASARESVRELSDCDFFVRFETTDGKELHLRADHVVAVRE